MQKTDINYVNSIVLQGVVVHKYTTNKATIITLKIQGPSGISNAPKVVCFSENALRASNYDLNDHITVTGNIQSSKRVLNDKEFYTQAVFAESISETPRAMGEAFGLAGGTYLPPCNEFKLAGIVTSIVTPSSDVIRITLRTVKNGRTSIVQAFYHTKEVGKYMQQIRVNDYICGVGSLQTAKKIKDGETKYYENVVFTDLVKP